ncbi:MAG: HAD-IIB family hydrolase, partial [Pseudomonadota bacterium]
MIFTDLDGTLLDHETYEWKEAEPALNRCKLLRIPLILVSSKTRAEINVIRNELGLTAPFISENGGGIFFPPEETHEPPP